MNYKKLWTFFVLPILFFSFSSQVIANENDEEATSFSAAANHVIAIEANTGKILYEKDSETVTGTASTSKLLTIYLIYEALKEGKIALEDQVMISDYAYELSLNTDIANVPLDARIYSVKELLDATIVYSANGASVALAEHVSGTEARFVDVMSAKVKEWGITDAKLVNASGLSNTYLGDRRYPGSGKRAENMMSAKSLAIIAQRLIIDYPQVIETTSLLSVDFAYMTVSTWNLLLKGAMYSRPNVDGLMTGTSEKSGSSLVVSSTEDYMRVITVLLGAHGGQEDPYARFIATNDVLNYVKNNYYLYTILKEGKSLNKSKANIFNGSESTVVAVAKEDFNVVQRRGEEVNSIIYKPNKKTLEAPVKTGDSVGTVIFEDDGYINKAPEMVMVAKKDVNRAFFLTVWWNNFVKWVNEEL